MSAKKYGSEEPIALGPFLKKLEELLQSLSPVQMRETLLRHARGLAPKERENLLSIFTERGESVIETVDDPELISDINALIRDLENGEYYDGWGYDHDIGDERAFGDESWADEMNDLFNRTGKVFLSGNRSLASKAYGLLLHAFELGEETGTFSGPRPPQFMIATDVDEAKTRYLRSLYETSIPNQRAACLLKEISSLVYTGSSQVDLRAIMEADDKPLEDFNAFLPEWLRALKEEETEKDYGRLLFRAQCPGR